MIADVTTNKKFQAIIKNLFIRCRKLNISLVFIAQSYFSVPKDVRLNSTHYLIMKINNRKELQNIAINHSTDIDYKDFLKIYFQKKFIDCLEMFLVFLVSMMICMNFPLLCLKRRIYTQTISNQNK